MQSKRLLLMLIGIVPIVVGLWLGTASALQSNSENAPGVIKKNGLDVDIRSLGRQIAEEVAALGNRVADEISPSSPAGGNIVPQIQFRGGNIQVNDPSLDNIQVFPGFRPFVKYTQSETSVAAYGPNIVAAYNSSANQPLIQASPTTLAFTHRFLSAFSVSNDGGKSWSSGFFPPLPGSSFTFGDPALDVDRDGNFYFAGLGANAAGQPTIQVNKSTDGGRTWSAAVLVQQDNGSDKEWLAVGPDPVDRARDNVYVTWSSFQTSGVQLRFGRSVDGGATWSTKTILAPAANPNPALPQNGLQFSNTYVDKVTGTVYIPFLHFSNSDQDFIRILISNDAGETFRFATFNVAPDPTLLPITSAGELTDCRSGGLRLTIHSGPEQPSRFGAAVRSFRNASRLTTQPAFAARNGILDLAWSNSTSLIFGDRTSNSNIMFMRSTDGGNTWSSPIHVNPSVAADTQHVLPSLSLDAGPNDVHIGYYTQHTDGTLDVDLANSNDRGVSFPSNRTVRLTGSPMSLPPTNVTLSATTSTNYDRTIQPCYALGEYMSVRSANGSTHVLWGDTHNSVTQPVNALDPISGLTHPQEDVVYQRLMAH